PVLHRVEVLKFVDEDRVPPCTHLRHLVRALEQLRRLEHQHVEVDHSAIGEKALVTVEEHEIVMRQPVAAKAMRGKARQRLTMPPARSVQPAKSAELIVLIGDTEALIQQQPRAELA